MEYKDYYSVLGVGRKASDDEIKQAYRRLARKYHPDVSKEANAEEQFKNVQEAYEVLKDAEKRRAYDELGSNWKAGQDFRPPPGWDQNSRFHASGGNGPEGFAEGDFSDFFANLFGAGTSRRRASGFSGDEFAGFKQRGRDQQAKINISLREAFKGVNKTLQMQVPEMDAHGNMHYAMRTIKVTVPPGTSQGQQLRLANQGMPGIGGGPAGDLFLEVHLEPDHMFSLQGRDVYLTLPVTPWEAALGAEIKVPTLAGNVGMKLAPGMQAGQKLRLKGRGMPGKSGPGDQYAIIQIQTPKAQTDEQRQIYEKMAQAMPFDPRKEWQR